jgi:hypothetical protein
MKAYVGEEVQFYAFFFSAVDGRGQLNAPAALAPKKNSQSERDAEEKIFCA